MTDHTVVARQEEYRFHTDEGKETHFSRDEHPDS
jgi:hypothetical protein